MAADESQGQGGGRRTVGRPTVAPERRAEILLAVEECVVRYGLAGTTLNRIAQIAGIPRSNLAHFVGNRDEIVDLAIVDSVTRFTDAMVDGVADVAPAERLPVFLDLVLVADERSQRAITILNELFAAASRDGHARDVLAPSMLRIDRFIAGMVDDRYPHAEPERRRATGVVLPLILRERDRMLSINDRAEEPVATDDVRSAIDALLDQLGPPAAG